MIDSNGKLGRGFGWGSGCIGVGHLFSGKLLDGSFHANPSILARPPAGQQMVLVSLEREKEKMSKQNLNPNAKLCGAQEQNWMKNMCILHLQELLQWGGLLLGGLLGCLLDGSKRLRGYSGIGPLIWPV